VGDVDGGDAEAALQGGDLGAGLHAELGVEVGQRLVHEEALGLADDRPAHRDALALARRECLGLAVEVGVRSRIRAASSTRLRISPLSMRAIFSAKPMLSATGHVRVERVVLEHHGDVAVLGRDVGDVAVADRIAPPSTSSSPASIRSEVDLPQPDGPTRTRNSPSAISRFSASTAGCVAPG
jgi:hypothetical protein